MIMLNPEDMSKVVIAAHKDLMEQIINEMHNMKVIHIKDHKSNEMAGIGSPFEEASFISGMLVKARSLASVFNIKKGGYKIKNKIKNRNEINKKLNILQSEINSKQEALKSIEAEIEKNKFLTEELNKFSGIEVYLEHLTSYKTIAYFAGQVSDAKKLENGLKQAAIRYALFKSKDEANSTFVLVVDADRKKDAYDLLNSHKFTPVNTMAFEGMHNTPEYNIEKLQRAGKELSKKAESIKKYVDWLGKTNGEFLFGAESFLAEELEKAEAPLRFGETSTVFVASGYVPKKNEKSFEERIKKINDTIFVKFSEPAKGEEPPVKLANQKPVDSFEFFLNLYTLPSYKELDPTFFIFMTFPILFGFILGDIGYGLVSLAISLIMMRALPKLKGFFNILTFASLASIAFGFVFGEFFGFEELGHFELPHLISRSHDMTTLLIWALVVGIIHINIGFLVGFVNEKSSHGLAHAINAKGGWIVLEVGLLLLAGYFLKWFNFHWLIGAGVSLISVIMIFKGEGIRGILELPSIFSNVMSYARLMAIGTSSVMLALTINQMSEELFHGNIIMIALGILILIVGHIINIALGLLGSFLHSLRLEYVEFFSKF
ncbi:MAG: V-type ATP synthase subunit I, partial [Nanoarchaeota archaeon]|nr:V-type ATP synthase subunit I [Nanoarchaeota archaeon]